MVDEFQDTNRLQLDVLEALERDNLFAVGDESQSIYGFRHADVGIFRARRARAAAPAASARLTVNFRSRPEILDVVNAAFAPLLGPGFTPLVPGRGPDELRLFAPDPPDEPRVELLAVRDRRLGGARGRARPRHARRAAVAPRRGARRRRAAARGGRRRPARRRPRRARARDELAAALRAGARGAGRCRPTSSAAAATGRRSRSATASPTSPCSPTRSTRRRSTRRSRRRSAAPAPTRSCCSPRPGRSERRRRLGGAARPPATWLGALPERRGRAGSWPSRASPPASALRAERLPVEVLLERAIAGHRLRPRDPRRRRRRPPAGQPAQADAARARVRAAEGRDLRGFLAYAAEQDLAEAREGEAALESEGLDAVRLMTIHRAKGLEFPVVCVADLGRPGSRRARAAAASAPRRRAPGSGSRRSRAAIPCRRSATTRSPSELTAAEAAEERRLLYVAATRAEERLILSGGIDTEQWPAPRPGGPPLDWLAPALLGDPAAAAASPERRRWPAAATAPSPCGSSRRRRCPPAAAAPAPRERAARRPGRRCRPSPKVVPRAARPPARAAAGSRTRRCRTTRAARTASTSSACCGLPRVAAPPDPAADAAAADGRRARGAPARHARPRLLERLDFARPAAPAPSAVRALAAALGLALRRRAGRATSQRSSRRSRPRRCARGSPAVRAASGARRPSRSRSSRRRRPARAPASSTCSRASPTATCCRRLQDRPARRRDAPAALVERDYATQRMVYALAGARSTRAPSASRSPTACSSARGAGRRRRSRTPTRRRSPTRCSRSPAACSPSAGPSPRAPHRELCGDCPGRRALCSWPEAMTLRPAHAASAGSLAGSGGPS